MTTALAACRTVAPPTQPAGGAQPSIAPATIQWYTRNSYQDEALAAWITPWTQAHPQLKIEPIMSSGGTAASKEKLVTLVVGGQSPDVVSGFTGAFLMVDVIQPIEDLIQRDRFATQRFEPKNWEAGAKYQGRAYMLPQGFGGDAVVLVYNRGLFQAAGAREPAADWRSTWTWDEFRDALRRTTRSDGGKIVQVGLAGYGYFLDTIPKPWGGEWLAAGFRTVTCDTPQMIQAYETYLEVVYGDRTTFQTPDADLGSGNAFLNGRGAVTSAGGVPLAFVKQADTAGIDWAFAPLPKGSLPAATTDMAATHSGLMKDTRARDAAWEFVKWCVDEGRLATLEDRIPNMPSLVDAWARRTWAGRSTVRPEVLASSLAFTSPMERLFMHPSWPKMSTEFVVPIWNDMLARKISVRDGLASAKRQIQLAVDEFERNKPAS